MKTPVVCGRVLWLVATVGAFAPRLPAAFVSGDAREVASDVLHSNGNRYDQVLLTGPSATVRADAAQVTRVSFLDLNEDILQVELSGAGSLALSLESASGPARATKYNQPDVFYMRGHARIRITGSDASTSVAVFSVGPANAVNQAIIKAGEIYDGMADIAEIEMVADPANPNGSNFGGIWAGNASFWAHSGRTGIYAPNVHVQNIVRIADLSAFDTASPALVFGRSQFGVLEVTTGTLAQQNERLIQVGDYRFGISFLSGGIVFVVPPSPGMGGSYWYLTGHDGTPLLWVVPWKAG